MIDLHHPPLPAYDPPAIIRIGAVPDVAAELAKLGMEGTIFAYQPGDFVDWSNGRVS